MTYLGLIWAGVWRKPARTAFTLLSIAAAFVLFGVLQGVNAYFERVVDAGRLDLLITGSPNSLALPLAELPFIQKVAGVSTVTYQSGFVGYYQSIRNAVPVSAVEPQHVLLALPPESSITEAELAAFRRTRTGAIISARLAQRLHWAIGDHVPVQAPDVPQGDGSTVWTFDIVGIYASRSNPAQLGLFMNYLYFDANRVAGKGTVNTYLEQIADPSRAAAIASHIDARFQSSADPTRTDTERGYAQGVLGEIGDLALFVDLIIGAAFATLLLLTGSNMMQSFRERIAELAVMKTLGFTDGCVAALMLWEGVLPCAAAAALGIGAAAAVLASMGWVSGGDVPPVTLQWGVALYGVSAAMGIALVSALPAALRARRITIVRALAGG